jgi:hypothetical protein
MIDGLGEEVKGGHIFQIADVLAQKGLVLSRHADRILQSGATGQYGRHLFFKKYGDRDISPGATDETGVSSGSFDNGIIAAKIDIPVMDQKIIGNI